MIEAPQYAVLGRAQRQAYKRRRRQRRMAEGIGMICIAHRAIRERFTRRAIIWAARHAVDLFQKLTQPARSSTPCRAPATTNQHARERRIDSAQQESSHQLILVSKRG